MSRPGLFQPYMEFAEALVNDHDDRTVVFLARDALPLHRLVDHIAERRSVRVDTQDFEFSRAMLPQQLRKRLDSLKRPPTRYSAQAPGVLEEFLRHTPVDDVTRRYIRQELGRLQRVLLVDTGYWGSVLGYVSTCLDFSGADVGSRQIFGPPGSSAFRESDCEHDSTQQLESAFTWSYDFSGEIGRCEEGRLYAIRNILQHPEGLCDVEIACLLELYDMQA